ncbi:MAG: hypothetical protein QXZ43_01430 [Candidatus Aenigmatarchaeota archaeon]
MKRLCNFDFFTCVKDYFNYHIKQLKGECYIKNYPKKGISNISAKLPIDVYLINPEKLNLNYYDLSKTILGVNDIWKDYGVQFEIRNITEYYFEKDYIILQCNDELVELAINATRDRLYDKVIDVFIIPEIKTRILFYDDSGQEGFGWTSFDCKNIHNINFVVIKTRNVKNITWNLAHEFSHILGNEDYEYFSGQYNFMTNSGCIKDKFYSTVLNQKQVDIINSRVKNIINQ